MDTLTSMNVFRQVVDLGSFSKAAEHLAISPAMASKHLRHLEDCLQAKLLNRSSRHLSLTEVGQNYYRECCHALDILDSARQTAQQGVVNPQGTLKITLPIWLATPYFAQILQQYRTLYPEVRLSLYLDNQRTDLIAHGFDLALRVDRSIDPNIIVKPLTEIDFYWVTSPRYFQTLPEPITPQNLERHLAVTPNYTSVDYTVNSVADSNNTMMLKELVVAGMGIACLPEWAMLAELQQGRLIKILNAQKAQTLKLYAAYMNREHLSAKIRTFIDFLAQRLAE
ncbi:DNA-binding transcriptional regulator, LysR family [Pasteurella testudinis DSM 23072]|uniref:DNA-binding transcriptional regulator, LysR family n=1 Tax=Pasteurella testudinis DSM 23072 TaxID=1122938 RepID=A0A1W1UV98_9PAST|nr:LysR family transcriptional regulator [Pasteurella testudinis]SMB85027.1 DNA-binding transcriptional regulator, LysR family [Pasteurella testudinis DSM 23072]SUB52908.1 glycine cleavage system transcriptional activator [Pasteurella testudinis]